MSKAKHLKPPVGARIGPENPFHDIVARAFELFPRDRPEETGVCRWCCMEPEIERDLFTPDPRDLPLHYLRDWFFAACEPPVPALTWRWLLPRILEVLAAGEDPASVGMEVSLDRYPTGDADRWRAEEWAVLEDFRRLYLQRCLDGGPEMLDDVLCMFHRGGWPLPALLEQVAAAPDAALAERLWRDWCFGRPAIWIDAFWEGGGNSAVWDFYTSRALYERMARLAFGPAAPEVLAQKALEVAALIERDADWAQDC